MSSPAFVTLDALSARSPDATPLFDDLTLAFGREKTGLVGRNGVGKTTLLRLILGEVEPAAGAVSRVGSVGLLRQTADPQSDETVADTLGVAAPWTVVQRVLAGQGTPADLDAADWSLEDRIASALTEVGLSDFSLDRATATLSGGEQTRLRIAALLIAAPDLILLDEPTNNLDAASRAVVADVIDRWKGGAVVVSHDRALLRRMDRIVELSSLGAATYGGNYELYVERKAAERAAAERGLETAERGLAQVEREAQRAVEKKARRDAAGKRFAAGGSIPRILAGARADRAEDTAGEGRRLAARRRDQADAALNEARERVERVRALSVPMPPTGLAAGRTVLVMEEVTVAFPPRSCGEGDREAVEGLHPHSDRPVESAPGAAGPSTASRSPSPLYGEEKRIGPASLRMTGPERIAITGPNGAGKTTLLRLMVGDLAPTSGRVERPVRAALLDQHAAILRPSETLIEAYRRLNPEATPNDAHGALARFLFRNAQALKRVETLSGGERLRAALACIMTGARPPQLLILDEPTNHLDLDALEAVEAALNAYDGALIVVSHDADFLDAIGVERRVALRPCGSG